MWLRSVEGTVHFSAESYYMCPCLFLLPTPALRWGCQYGAYRLRAAPTGMPVRVYGSGLHLPGRVRVSYLLVYRGLGCRRVLCMRDTYLSIQRFSSITSGRSRSHAHIVVARFNPQGVKENSGTNLSRIQQVRIRSYSRSHTPDIHCNASPSQP